MTGVDAKAIVRDAARIGVAVSAWCNKDEWTVTVPCGPIRWGRDMKDAVEARRAIGI